MLDKNPSMGIPSASNTSSSTSAALFSIPVNLSSASIASNKLTIVKSLSASRGFEESLLSDFEAITSKYNNKKNLSSSEQYLSATDDAAAAHPPSSLSTSPASPGLPLTRAGTRKPNNSNNNLIIACYVKVLHDYIPRDADELGLEEEDVVTLYKADIMEKDSSGWLYGENNGNWGFFPASHVKFLTEEEALAEGIATSSSLTNATTTTTNGGTASSSLHSLQRDTTGTEQASSSGSGGGGTTKAWFSKYKKMPRYEKKMPSSNKIGLAFDDGTTTAPFATMKNNSISHSSETLISENDDNNSNKQNTTTTTTDSSLTRNRKTSDPVSRSDSHLNVESDLNRSKSVRKPSDTTTTTLHNGTTNATSNTILVTAPLPSVSTSATSPAATAPTIVSIVGAPAVMKPRWVDFMGGNEAVSKLGLTKKEIQRQEVIYEILTTERDYVNDLEIVIEVRRGEERGGWCSVGCGGVGCGVVWLKRGGK